MKHNYANIAFRVSVIACMLFCCATLYSISSCLNRAVNEPIAQEDEMRAFDPNDKGDGMVLMYNTRTGEAMVFQVKGDDKK